ncbi:MAG: SIS domain-containing protein [Pseudomonadota bacterium]
MTRFADTARAACSEIAEAASGVSDAAADGLVEAMVNARRIVTYGVGREGLMMRALAMRLYHMGLDVGVQGDMTAPAIGKGDLLVVSAGPGHFSTVAALMGVAKEAGAATAAITAQPAGKVPQAADHVLTIPAQTMANDQDPSAASLLPMGSLYEGAQYVVFEILVLMLRERLGATPEAMRARHTNLE